MLKKCKLGRYRFGYMSILVILSTVTMIYQMNKFELVTSLISQLNYKTELQDIQRKEFSSHALNPVKTAGRQLKNKPNIFNANLTLSQWDSRHLFKFLDSVLSGDKFVELSNKYDVCLATQGSLEKLHSLVSVTENWSGPVSVSVFTAGEEFILTELYIAYMRQCFPQIRDRISFHLAYSPDYPPIKDHHNLTFNYEQSCNNPEAVLSDLLEHRNPKTVELISNKLLYPQNHLRNHARRNCQTKYVYLTDIDIIPSTGMADNLQEFLRQSRCEKLCAYVIPVYEIDKNVSFPQNKYQITNFAKEGLARPFHQMIYVNGHYSTNYKMWEDNTRDVQDAVHVNHNVTKCAGWYEPFYVAHAATPDFDERFIGYGFTRNTQVYEMIAAGYQFQVLSPIFSCHWGLQNITEVYNPWRKKQVFMNSRLITTFKSEIDARHRNVAQFPALPLHADSRQTRSDWRTQIPATQTLELGRIP
ncbi:beta-1,4-glucuronyltransferase 1-like isoform X2 [Zootermopsis nevadensis]|uniref:beta-1,4-glucuronyltransferase 1-like isoform X2 n=1 Tax=Zootermopsis nevadensis TaxID=136037 RepID=UPI000B8E47A5|nr:beta-1,4-glucuronyltransferase 1-like isoform X2 [Zootermopsis nevadensis]